MLKKLILSAGFIVALGAVHSAFADNLPACNSGFNVTSVVSLDGKELSLIIEDTQEVANACDYYVERFSYLESLHAMDIVVKAPMPCTIDRYGKRKGQMKWNIPMQMRGRSLVEVIVNSAHVGSVSVDGPKAEFVPNPCSN